ncbi:MAG: TatD family hydrolase [Candidatus Aminicenantaceae bacterium]
MEEIYELVDSHAHLDMEDFDPDRDQVLERAFKGGVKAILCPAEASKPKSLEIAIDLTSRYKNLSAAAGIHPHHAKYFNPDSAQNIRKLALSKSIAAVGEIGLDFHYNFSPPQKQREAFRTQLNLAQELTLPVIVHSRKAGHEVIDSVKDEQFTQGGILHCFTEDWETAQKMMNCNFLISFSGILTYPKAHSLREVAKKIPLEKLLVETDSPYLVPVPYRGKITRNEPRYVVETAKVLAGIKKTSVAEIAEITSKNFNNFIGVRLS